MSDGVNLFAGPGGTCEGARQAGLELLGIEWDDAACATREAAGHPTLQADVAELDPQEFAPCEWLAGSPPCQARSMAGKRGGEKDLRHVVRCAHELAAGNDTRSEHRARCVDERSMLVVEPLRWALALRPRRIVLEQVPPVLAEWSLFASFLQAIGYRTWAGILSAERYGVPQTRKRAILMASLDGPVFPPAPTHQAYEPGVPAERQHTLEGELEPWVSMAEALGWGMTERPGTTVMAKPNERGGHRELCGGTGARRRVQAERERGAWWEQIDRPAPTVTGGGTASGGAEPFARGGREALREVLRTHNFTSTGYDGENRALYERPIEQPSPTVDGRADLWEIDGASRNVRITIAQAAALQGFRPDYPWQGTLGQRFTQVGNAVPPPLARAIFAALIADVERSEAAA